MTALDFPAWLTLAVAALAAARLWRLAAADTITEPVRAWLLPESKHRLPTPLSVFSAKLLYCPWCLGFWLSLASVLAAYAWHETLAWQLVAGTLAVSFLVGHLGSRNSE